MWDGGSLSHTNPHPTSHKKVYTQVRVLIIEKSVAEAAATRATERRYIMMTTTKGNIRRDADGGQRSSQRTYYKLDLPICTSSYDRMQDWKRCCAMVMGYEWVDDEENHEEEAGEGGRQGLFDRGRTYGNSSSMMMTQVQITNLLDEDTLFGPVDDDEEEKQESKKEDHWMENAIRIQTDLTKMSKWIKSKSQAFISLDMKDEEASLIQSTITTYAATTANELETLRKMISMEENSNSRSRFSDIADHRSAIVQILVLQLTEQITHPFGILQKQRTRVATQIWQNPIQCKLYQPKAKNKKTNTGDNIGDILFSGEEEEPPAEQRFLPRHPPQESYNSNYYDIFVSQYNNSNANGLTGESSRIIVVPPRPAFLSRFEENHPNQNQVVEHEQEEKDSSYDDDLDLDFGDDDVDHPDPRSTGTDIDHLADKLNNRTIQQQQQQSLPYDYYDDQQNQQEQEPFRDEDAIMAEEARLLTQAIQHNDLDSVQQMEQRMVTITQLISQFSNLISTQHEDVVMINEASKDVKQNMEKGQENLLDATERTKQSKHYMAYAILIMAIILQFFHLLRN